MIREEHMDLFASSAGGVYAPDKKLSEVQNGTPFSSAVLDLGDNAFKVPVFRIHLAMTEAAATSNGAKLVVEIKHGREQDGTFYTLSKQTFAASELGIGEINNYRLPSGALRFLKVELSLAASGTAFTAGKIFGNVQPEIA